MELALYVSVVLLAIAFSRTFRPLESQRLFEFSSIVGFALFSAGVRTSGFDADIVTYAQQMNSYELGVYYLREPVVWLGHRLFFTLTQSHLLSFMISDVLCFIVLTRAFRHLGLPQYALIAVVAFFPFVLGMQNIYRQWVAGCLAVYALSLSDRNLWRSFLVFGLSIASHNAAAIFAPAIFSRAHGSVSLPLTLVWVLVGPAILMFGAGTKSNATTGLDMEFAYLALIMATAALTCHPILGRWKRWTGILIAYCVYVVVWSIIALSSAGAERIALFALFLIYPAIVESIENNYKEKPLLRSGLAVFGFLPMLLFGVREFIL